MRLPEGTFDGVVAPRGDVVLGRVVAALEFTHRPEGLPVGAPNIEIAQRIENDPYLRYGAMLCSQSVALGFEELGSDIEPVKIFDGPSAKGVCENTGTFGELEQTKAYMDAHGYRPHELVLLTNGHNLGNALRQAHLIGLDPIIPWDQPTSFDSESDQWWNRNKAIWVVTSPVRITAQKLKKH